MCYLCIQNNPFGIQDMSNDKLEAKKERAKLVKELVNFWETEQTCESGKQELAKLKEEQYQLSREM